MPAPKETKKPSPQEPLSIKEREAAAAVEREHRHIIEWEQMLCDVLDPSDDQPIELPVLLDLFAATVLDAHKRNYDDEHFAQVLIRCCTLHTTAAHLEAAHLYGSILRKMGQETPNINNATQEILKHIRQLREEAVKDLKLSLEMKSPDVTPS